MECEICLDTIPNHSEKCPTCLIELPIEKPVGDKRNSPRFPIKRPIRVIYEDGSMEQSLGNISTSGCMVHSFFPKSIHDEVEVEIKIAENNSTKLKGKVIRTLKNHPFMGNLSYEHLRIPINCTKCDFKIVEKSPNFDKCPNCKAELVKQVPHVYGIGIMFDDMDPKERLLLSRLISGLHNESKRLKRNRDHSRTALNHHPALVLVNIESEQELFHTYIRDISSGGMFVLSEQDLKINQEVEIVITYQDEEHFNFNAKIIHTKAFHIGGKKMKGYGLQFFPLTQEIIEAVRKFKDAFKIEEVYKYEEGLRNKKDAIQFRENLQIFQIGTLIVIFIILAALYLGGFF